MTPPTDLIDRYFALAPNSDTDAYFAQFRSDAVVEDEGQLRHGIDEIRAWRTEVPLVGYAVASVEPDGDGWVAAAEISGDFPGSPVVLRFRFTFDAEGKIASLSIRV